MGSKLLVTLLALLLSVVHAAPSWNTRRRNVDEYYVGTRWPTVPFEVPESWAGLMPIKEADGNSSSKNDQFFWYFKEETSCGSKDDLVVWLNGGPGCSSLMGLLEENGPVLFPDNITGRPEQPYVKLNPYSFNKLASVVWVEQPIGTGFTTGTIDAKSYRDIAAEFFSFLRNFYDTFPENKKKNLWITGESAAGEYIPYIADYIYSQQGASKASGIHLKGISINDPLFTSYFLGEDAATVPFVQTWYKELGLSDKFLDKFYEKAKSKGAYDYVEKNLVYPALEGGIAPPFTTDDYSLWTDVVNEAETIFNGTFNVYNVKESAPMEDPMGFPPSTEDISRRNILNDIPGFKEMIHAPNKTWVACGSAFATQPHDLPPDVSVLLGVIENSERTLIQHGLNDFVLLANGSALAIQNMTWGGARGFQYRPSGTLRVGGEDAGTYHSERGLTFITVLDSGHMIPEDKPEAAFKNLQYLLGQISYEDLGKDNAGCKIAPTSNFTTTKPQSSNYRPKTSPASTSTVSKVRSNSSMPLSSFVSTIYPTSTSRVVGPPQSNPYSSTIGSTSSALKGSVTELISTFVTYCPSPTTFGYGDTSITVTAPTTLTLSGANSTGKAIPSAMEPSNPTAVSPLVGNGAQKQSISILALLSILIQFL